MSTDKPMVRDENSSSEVSEMAVLAKPANISFELDPKKADSFFAVSKKKLYEKAIARSDAHVKRANESKEK